ncbi:hypothetical protein C347_02402 [Cryptococcus neoformans AD2-60a]|uniref:Uncharacterized protein n=1 Tax=Cryptococcus neoformans (strain H99 / ATCC 208821 / CBS 10515 / FGSC 9487) TaxID=235443 RepID=J9VJ59_CRYN9|nr:hypothetical protein CNAG_04998 [Cryptococcus neoformans var. grubii H99]AFR94263.1 hypothetical protein CNAG_04998 [Cryptococcus neoformans var. grubii H99]AUB23896.1 hypothetical protein CKF44_04998 [Cryptococcus neoformans var. grubii]OWZ33381.1 hypothetical protein C347_02402 [Cryptococcus neoformans var. grubii AD2-60a]|eukprot:XP_012048648.1 hypothetical protein CNAG_04998 [Cryptococcus neoformans var. grubii H99]
MSSSTTSSAGDRKKPRQLTREELWSSYCEKITKQEYLDALDNYTRPTEYPLKRRTYYLFPPAVAVEKQAVRLFKLSLRDNAAQGTTSVVEEAFEMLKLSSTSEGILEKCLAHNDLKRAGNVEFRKGNYLAALRKYSEKWNSYLPYHVDAFPKDHPLRTKLGEAEASLFNSMSACRRACDLIDQLYLGGLKKKAKILNQLFKIQADSIQDLDMDKLFKDVSSDLKVSQPTHKITSDFGPSGWATTYLRPKGQPDPEASNVTYQQWHPRELDESELWLAWDRPDSGIPDAHMEYLRTPAIYSDKRCVYELLPSGVVQVVHSLRQHCWSKLSIYEIVFRHHNKDYAGELYFETDHRRFQASVKSLPLSDRIDWAVKEKDAANKTRLGLFETAIWSNVSAAFLALANLDRGAAHFRRLGFMSAWLAFADKEYATVGVVKDACKRALASVPPWDPVRQDEDAIESMKMIWQTHIAVLSVQSNDKRMFREISQSLRGMNAPQLFIKQIGPPMWYEEFEAMKHERGWFR